MATLEQCETALRDLSAIIAGSAGANERSLRRSVSCHITDLDAAFIGELRDGGLQDLRRDDSAERADIAITTASDDLVKLVDGSLGFASAWAAGRVKIDASLMDLLRLRKLL